MRGILSLQRALSAWRPSQAVSRAAPALLLACLAGGCDDVVWGQSNGSSATCDRDPPLTWENYGEGFLGQHCNGCHSSYLRPEQRNNAPVGVDFNTWDDAVFWADRIEARTISDQSMPPGGGPSGEERVAFGEWVRCELLRAASNQSGGGQ